MSLGNYWGLICLGYCQGTWGFKLKRSWYWWSESNVGPVCWHFTGVFEWPKSCKTPTAWMSERMSSDSSTRCHVTIFSCLIGWSFRHSSHLGIIKGQIVKHHLFDTFELSGQSLLKATDYDEITAHSALRIHDERHGYRVNDIGSEAHAIKQHKSTVSYNSRNVGDY